MGPPRERTFCGHVGLAARLCAGHNLAKSFGDEVMQRDWVVWLGCFLIFCAGAVWAAVPIGTDFFVVKDLHDMFEIVSSIATFLAVGLAFIGINAWQNQVSGEADHELARRFSVAVLKYQNACVEAWADASFSILQTAYGIESLPPDLLDKVSSDLAVKLKKREEEKANFLGDLLEIKAIWGSDFSKKYDPLLNFCEQCNGCVRTFIAWSGPTINESMRGTFETILRRSESIFYDHGWMNIEGKVTETVAEFTVEADAMLQVKLLRSK